MLPISEKIAELIIHYLNDELSQEGFDELMQWMSQSADNRELAEEFMNQERLKESIKDVYSKERVWRSLIRNIEPAAGQSPVRRMLSLRRWWVAASVILLLGGGAYFWLSNMGKRAAISKSGSVDALRLAENIDPGKEGAILTLADGREVLLDSLGNGVVAAQNGAQIVLENGQLRYNGTGAAAEIAYNTMQTPKGRQFCIVLPDGSRVWLNSASSLRFPTVFSGEERRVEITGEAYFEVVRNEKQSFKISINKQAEVQVLGTSFNISAYNNDAAIKTTLIKGSVKVALDQPAGPAGQHRSEIILKPGQQAQIPNLNAPANTVDPAGRQKSPRIDLVNNANIDKVIAWKNGLFNFENASLFDLMHQLERWYNISVQFEENVPDVQFGGEMSRNVPLSEVLNALAGYGVHFRMDQGNRLTVLR